MGTPSGTSLAPQQRGTISSRISLSNPLAPDKPLKLQLRVEYVAGKERRRASIAVPL
jgi:hypothetical protein